jgi:hypothetical protein
VTARTEQGKAPMCGPGWAPACPLSSDRSAREDSGVKCDCAPWHLGALVLITTGDLRITRVLQGAPHRSKP